MVCLLILYLISGQEWFDEDAVTEFKAAEEV